MNRVVKYVGLETVQNLQTFAERIGVAPGLFSKIKDQGNNGKPGRGTPVITVLLLFTAVLHNLPPIIRPIIANHPQ